ncbi:MAG: PAS domain-containing protein [Bacillus subtilis]|nr:PAS domain-containing protein [Bacillus subtilis]
MPLGLALHEILLDKDGKPVNYRFLNANEAYERITGLKRKDILGKTPARRHPQCGTHLDRYVREGRPHRRTRSNSKNTPPPSNRHFHVYRLFAKKGQFAVIVEDITRRIETQKEIERREKDLVATQSIAKIGSWRLDVRTNEVAWTDELYKMYGFDPTQPGTALYRAYEAFREGFRGRAFPARSKPRSATAFPTNSNSR